MIDLVFQNIATDNYGREFFEKILSEAVKELGLSDKKIEMSVNLVGNEEMQELNRQYRNKDKATDVLSFPVEHKPLAETGIWPLGDIFISVEFAKSEAKSENIDIDRKMAQLTVHGFLHLLGYDHEVSEKEAGKMFDLEEKILNKLNQTA